MNQKYDLLSEFTDTMDVVETLVKHSIQHFNQSNLEDFNEKAFGVFLLLHTFFEKLEKRIDPFAFEYRLIYEPNSLDWDKTIANAMDSKA